MTRQEGREKRRKKEGSKSKKEGKEEEGRKDVEAMGIFSLFYKLKQGKSLFTY